MPTITARILQSTGLNSAVGSIASRELGITSDTERPVIGSTVGGPKFIATEGLTIITTTNPAPLAVSRRSRAVVYVDLATAGGDVSLDIQAGAQVQGYQAEVIAAGPAGRQVVVTYASGQAIAVAAGSSQLFTWSGTAWQLPIPRLPAAALLDLIKTVDGVGSGLDADLFQGLTPAQFIATYVQPVGSYYTQYPAASSNTDSVEFPVSERPATLFGGTWAERWATESIYFRTRGTLSDNGRVNGKQEDSLQLHGHRNLFSVSGSGGTQERAVLNTAGTGNTSRDNVVTSLVEFGAGGTPRAEAETRTVNRRFKIWNRTA